MNQHKQNFLENTIEYTIFSSRYLQAPIYLGLIIAQAVYVYRFGIELWHLVASAATITEEAIVLSVLGLVDVAMIANLLQMIVVGGYSMFVSKLVVADGHPDKPEWLSSINPNMMKVKLGMALVGISSIHLLKTFINAGHISWDIAWKQIIIHCVFVVSTLTLAAIDRLTKH